MKIIQVGTKVKYRTAAGRVRAATVTGVINQSSLNLRIGRGATAQSLSTVSKVSRKGSTAGWF